MNPLQFLSPHDAKVVGATFVAIIAAVGEIANDLAGYESVSLKVLLLIGIGILGNELRRQRDKYDAEAARREERMATALESAKEASKEQAAAVLELKNATETQTAYFKTVAQQIINASVHPKLPE